MKFENETQFECYVRNVIEEDITSKFPEIYALSSKKTVDIVICRDGKSPKVFFLEVKFHKKNHGRLGFGSRAGAGFQPEILSKEPAYFEQNLMWVLSNEDITDGSLLLLNNQQLRGSVSGGAIGNKFNNIQKSVFKKHNWLYRSGFSGELKKWLTD